jgi:hypothetical protein
MADKDFRRSIEDYRIASEKLNAILTEANQQLQKGDYDAERMNTVFDEITQVGPLIESTLMDKSIKHRTNG